MQLNVETNSNGKSQVFFGSRDPEYGEISCEQAFKELHEKAEGYLDAFG